MSTFVLTVHGIMGDVLAQGNPPEPEPPPDSDRYLQLVRYLIWFAALVLPILVVIGGGVAVLMIRKKRKGQDRKQTPSAAGEQPRWTPPVQQPLIAKHRYPAPDSTRHAPDPALPDDIVWGPPDPSVWGRPEQR